MMDKETKKCVNCGKEIEHYHYPLCFDCRPFNYPKRKSPHQKVRETDSWKENREKRLNQSGNRCDYCKKNLRYIDYTSYKRN